MASACSHHQSSKHSASAELLRLSAAAGNVQEVVRLLGEGAKIMSDEAGCTALQRAASQGHVIVVKQLLKHGADVNHQDNVHGNSALHEASWKGYSQTVAALCKGRAQLQLKNRGGFAALHLCCQNGHNQSCRELLFAGCNPDVQNNYGDTSLHTSARYGHAGVTRILISAQCRVSDQNKNGDTALHISAAMGRKKLTRILLEAGCDKSLRNKQNETARDIATRKDLKEILVILNTPPVALKSQSENKKKMSRSSQKKSEGEELHNKCQGKDHNDRKREKNGSGTSSKESNSQRKEKKHKNAHKVHFGKACATVTGRQWSPYGCHYYPDPETFPAPNLDSLPDEPLQKGEQYFLDLAGNICKGPVGVGYTCYCAPFFRNVEARLERDKQELKEHIDRAHERLDRKVSSLEQRLSHTVEKERSQCEARSLRLAEWICREISGFEAPYKCNEKHVNHKLWYGKAGYDIRRTKSLEVLPNEEPAKGERSKKPVLISNSDRVDMESSQSDHWNEVADDNSSFPEVLPNPCDIMLPSSRQCKDRFGSVDSLQRVCKGSWRLQRTHKADGNSNDNVLSKDDENDHRSSESSDGEDGVCQEVPSSLAMQELQHSDCSDVFQESNSQQVPDYENIVSFDHAIWKSGQEKQTSGVPYRSRTAVYDNVVSASAAVSADYQATETDLHNDSGYSTKVYGSSKGPSPSLSGNMDPDGSLPTLVVKPPKFSSIIRCEQQLAKHSYKCFHHFSANENDKIVKSRAAVISGFKVNGGLGSGSIV
ncbi:hypothetical protein J437_LFUL013058 [Ladona fulva]|uniref:Ankyrin repeat domain-containing protein 6 n=1 Tax=Ladona fulva TaxID=123851 RepID=A0A8K0P6U9_LADFU|nr:hypothetical protein J437_LFUL013058 [Ladona fulva]